MTNRLKNKVSFITGGANGNKGELMGIAGAYAWLASIEGSAIVITDIDVDSGKLTADRINESGGRAVFVELDVTDETSWQKSIEFASDQFGGIDVLVNSAGIHTLKNTEETSSEEWDRMMAIHAKGTFLGTKYVVPEMRKRGGGSIVNISSMCAMFGSPTNTAYHAAKGAIRSFTKSAAIQYAHEGIRVNSIHPGYTETPFTIAPFSLPGALESRVSKIPLGRLASAEEIANPVLYLACEDSSYVTGAELVVDGGFLAQ